VVNSQTLLVVSGSPLSPSQTAMHTLATPRLFSSVRTCSQNFAPSLAVASPQPEDVAFPVHGDLDHHINGLLRT
jgi:hypothetical protein